MREDHTSLPVIAYMCFASVALMFLTLFAWEALPTYRYWVCPLMVYMTIFNYTKARQGIYDRWFSQKQASRLARWWWERRLRFWEAETTRLHNLNNELRHQHIQIGRWNPGYRTDPGRSVLNARNALVTKINKVLDVLRDAETKVTWYQQRLWPVPAARVQQPRKRR